MKKRNMNVNIVILRQLIKEVLIGISRQFMRGIKDFECQYCKHITSAKQKLSQHIKAVHAKIKDFKCQYCQYETSQKSHLNMHIKAIHAKIKDIKCQYYQ